jgi:hypothetical protein
MIKAIVFICVAPLALCVGLAVLCTFFLPAIVACKLYIAGEMGLSAMCVILQLFTIGVTIAVGYDL